MNRKTLLAYLVLPVAFIVAGCGTSKNVETDITENAQVIALNGTIVNQQQLSEIVESVYYVRLETSDASLVGNIQELILLDDHILILDGSGNQVMIFDALGNFLRKIKNEGQGPEQHGNIVNIAFDHEISQIIVAASGKFLWFDLEGNFVREVKSRLGGSHDVAYLGNSKLAIYSDYTQLDDDQNWHLLSVASDKALIIQDVMIPYNMNLVGNRTSLHDNFSLHKDTAYLVDPYKPYIWEVTSTNTRAIYKVDFGVHALPKDFEDKYLTNPSLDSDRIRAIENEKGYARFRGAAAQVTNNFLNFTYALSGEFREVLYDRKSNQALQLKIPIINDLDGTAYVVNRATHDGYFVSIATPSSLLTGVKKVEQPHKQLTDLLGRVQKEDNPILRFVKYKKIETRAVGSPNP